MNKNIFITAIILCSAASKTIAQFANHGGNLVTDPGTFIVLNDLDFVNHGPFIQSNGSIKFTGTATSYISGTHAPQFYNIVVDKRGTGLIALQTVITIDHQVQLSRGNLDLNGNILLLNALATLDGESEISSITGTSGGYIEITKNLNAPVAENPGNLGIAVTSSRNLGSTIIRCGHQSQKNLLGTGSTVLRYYDIIPTNNGGLGATLRINYFDTELNGNDEGLLSIWHSRDNQQWNNIGFSNKNMTSNYVEQTGIDSFQRFTLTNVHNALPLEWLSFTAKLVNGQTHLKWATSQEFNNDHFEVERSPNAGAFHKIMIVQSKGDNAGRTDYEAFDPELFPGIVSYRLNQVNMDGKHTYSPVVSVRVDKKPEITIYPNPTGGNLQLSFNGEKAKQIVLQLFDLKGRLIKQKNFSMNAGYNLVTWNISELAAGMYTIQSQDAGIPATQIMKR